MDSQKDDGLTNYLIDHAKSGSKSSFLQLSEYYFHHIFRIAYLLDPNVDNAKSITKTVFIKAASFIKQFEREESVLEWFKKITVIVAYYHIKSKEVADIESAINVKPKEGSNEAIFLSLTSYERITFILYEKFNLEISQISDALGGMGTNEVLSNLTNSIKKLSSISGSTYLKEFSIDQWRVINKTIILSEEERNLLFANKYDEVVEDYNELLEVLNQLFNEITYPDGLYEEIKNDLLTIYEKKVQKEIFDNQKNESSKKVSKFFAARDRAIKRTLKREKISIVEISFIKNIKYLYAVAILILIIGFGYYLNILVNSNSSSNSPWIITQSSSEYTINTKPSDTQKLFPSDYLICNSEDELIIDVPNLGTMFLSKFAEIKIDEAENGKSQISFFNGNLRYKSLLEIEDLDILSEDSPFIVKLEIGVINALAADFQISKLNNISLLCNDGWISITLGTRKLYLTKNYLLNINDIINKAIPFSIIASQEFKDAVNVNYTKKYSTQQIKHIVEKSSYEDALTLWHILPFSDLNGRKLLVDKLNDFYPVFGFGMYDSIISLSDEGIKFVISIILNDSIEK